MRDVYTPFFTVIAADLPASNFSHVTAHNGTVQTDAANQLACFLAMPGMRANFAGLGNGELDGLKDRLLDEVTLEADVKDFQMPVIMMAAATSMDQLTQAGTSLADLEGNLNELKDATGALQDGSKALSTAVATLKDNLEQLAQKYGVFDQGIASALAGAEELGQGTEQLDTGLKELADGTQQLETGSSALAQQLNEQLVPGLTQAAEKQQSLEQKMEEIQAALGNITLPNMDALKNQLREGVGSVFDKAAEGAALGAAGTAINGYGQVLQNVLAGSGLDEDTQANILAAVNASLSQNGVTAERIAGGVTAQMGDAREQAIAQVLTALEGMDLSQLEALMGQFSALSSQAQDMMDSVTALTQALYNAQNPADTHTVVGAATSIAAGAGQVNSGADTLKKGADRLDSGAKELIDGLASARSASIAIREAIGQFLDGAGSLQQGADQLQAGMDTYAEEGIGKLVERMENLNLGDAGEVLSAMQEQADGYRSYTGSPEGVKSTVKFLMKVESPATENEAEEQTETPDTEAPVSFWDRVKHLFG